MYKIALKMLFGDRTRYIMLISSLAFCSLLINQQGSIFAGLMLWTTSTIRNTHAEIWVMDPKVEQVTEAKPMRDTELARVRSVSGVAWALPFYTGIEQVKLRNGNFKTVQLIGLDTATLIGAPPKILKGTLQHLHQSNAIFIDRVGVEKLSETLPVPVDIGDTFEINDHEVRIVGVLEAARSFFGYPQIFTTYEKAISLSPPTRKNLSFILVKAGPNIDPEQLTSRIEKETGLKAMTENRFFWSTIRWFMKNTGIPISFGTTLVLGFLVGIGIAGQTFYSFVIENISNIGALKAMGASNSLLYKMIALQAFIVGVIGYGIGLGLAATFGLLVLKGGQPPFFMPIQIPLFTFSMIFLICLFSASLAIRRISKVETAEVFRG
jgi:putative ABC transport system permease protein